MCHGLERDSATIHAVPTTVPSRAGVWVDPSSIRRANAWLTRLAAVAARSDWQEVSAANRATHVDSRSMSNTHPKGSEARCSTGSRPETLLECSSFFGTVHMKSYGLSERKTVITGLVPTRYVTVFLVRPFFGSNSSSFTRQWRLASIASPASRISYDWSFAPDRHSISCTTTCGDFSCHDSGLRPAASYRELLGVYCAPQ